EIQDGRVMYATQDNEELQAVPGKTIIWTTGVSGSPVMGESGFKERRGRVIVNDNLLDPYHDDLYIIADVSALMYNTSDRPCQTTAQIDTRLAAHVVHANAQR